MSHTVLALIFAVIACAIVAFFACFSVTRKVQVSGILLPTQGLVRIQQPQAGVVTDIRVRESQMLRAGDVLFILTNERFSANLGDADQTIARLLQVRKRSFETERGQQLLQAQQRIRALEGSVANLKAEAIRIDQQIALQQRRVEMAIDATKRQVELRAANFVSAANLQDRQAEQIDQEQHLAELQRLKAANTREIMSALSNLGDQRVQARRDQEAATRSIAEIDQDVMQTEARRQIEIRAPHDGIITSISVSPGAAVIAGQTLATLVPSGSELEAELYAPSRAAGFIKPGMEVLIRYQAYPYQKFGQFPGRVQEVSEAPMQVADLALSPMVQAGAGAEPVFRIRARLAAQHIRPYGQDQALKPGMTVEASVLLERRRLYEWILEPLYSVTGRM
jgi:membrane fusion protein